MKQVKVVSTSSPIGVDEFEKILNKNLEALQKLSRFIHEIKFTEWANDETGGMTAYIIYEEKEVTN